MDSDTTPTPDGDAARLADIEGRLRSTMTAGERDDFDFILERLLTAEARARTLAAELVAAREALRCAKPYITAEINQMVITSMNPDLIEMEKAVEQKMIAALAAPEARP
jgi:hypothetical protein